MTHMRKIYQDSPLCMHLGPQHWTLDTRECGVSGLAKIRCSFNTQCIIPENQFIFANQQQAINPVQKWITRTPDTETPGNAYVEPTTAERHAEDRSGKTCRYTDSSGLTTPVPVVQLSSLID